MMVVTVLLLFFLILSILAVLPPGCPTDVNVMDGQTVQMEVMKLTVVRHHVKIKDYGIVVMANVSQHHMYVMVQLIYVLQAGDLTVLMAQMKA